MSNLNYSLSRDAVVINNYISESSSTLNCDLTSNSILKTKGQIIEDGSLSKIIRMNQNGNIRARFFIENGTVVGGNNVAIVSGHFGGQSISGHTTSFAFDATHQVTHNNTILVGVAAFQGTFTWAAGQITQTGGTATIGTPVLDQSTTPSAGNIEIAIYRIPVTGDGTLTLQWTQATLSPDFCGMGCAEFTGLSASPLGPTNTTSGISIQETTNAVTTTFPGVIFYVTSELSSTTWSRNASDVVVFNDSTGATDFTFLVQYKIVNSSPNTLTSATEGSSTNWKVAYAEYITS